MHIIGFHLHEISQAKLEAVIDLRETDGENFLGRMEVLYNMTTV